jgi:hypothetical protein
MGRGNKIDVVATSLLKGDHHEGKIVVGNFLAIPKVGDIVILTEYTAQSAVREKDCSRTPFPNQGGLFSKVGTTGRHDGKKTTLTFS